MAGRSPLIHFCNIFLAIFLTLFLLFPLSLCILFPFFYLWRLTAIIFSRLFCPNHRKILHSIAHLTCAEYPETFQRTSNGDLCLGAVLDGHLDFKSFCQTFMEKTILAKLDSDKNGQSLLENPELMHTITSFMGYLFWKKESHFSIEDHIQLYTGSGRTTDILFEEEMEKVLKKFSWKPFQPDKSPWQILLWPGIRLKNDPDQKTKSIIIARFHHSLTDGYSLLKISVGKEITQAIATEAVAQARGQCGGGGGAAAGGAPHDSKICKILGMTWTAFCLPFLLLWIVIGIIVQILEKDKKKPQIELSGKLNVSLSKVMCISDIKQIKKTMGCSFHTVVLAALAGGFQKFLDSQEENYFETPETAGLTCFIPLPIPNHPVKLRNHMTALTATIPLNEPDPFARIRKIEAICQSFRGSMVPMATFCFSRIIGSMPHWIVQLMAKGDGSCVMSNFSGPREKFLRDGLPLDDVHFGGGLFKKFGYAVSCLSYNGQVRLGFSADEAIFPDPHAVPKILQNILDEIQIMKGIDAV